jgi:hypothetical protein
MPPTLGYSFQSGETWICSRAAGSAHSSFREFLKCGMYELDGAGDSLRERTRISGELSRLRNLIVADKFLRAAMR